MKRRTLPKTSEALDRAYIECRDNKKFRIADKESFSDYIARSQRDIASAENDFNFGDFYWARVKAYQALFHMLNALLVKRIGYYSKDHACILTALLKESVITEEIASQLHLLVEGALKGSHSKAEGFIQDVNDFRIQRNFALYKPKAWEDVTKDDIKKELDKIKKNMAILGGLL